MALHLLLHGHSLRPCMARTCVPATQRQLPVHGVNRPSVPVTGEGDVRHVARTRMRRTAGGRRGQALPHTSGRMTCVSAEIQTPNPPDRVPPVRTMRPLYV